MELLCTCYHWAPIERRLLSNGRQERERAEKCSEKELNVGKKELKGERLSEDGGEMYTERIAWNIHWEWILFDYGYIYSCISFRFSRRVLIVLIHCRPHRSTGLTTKSFGNCLWLRYSKNQLRIYWQGIPELLYAGQKATHKSTPCTVH